MTKPIPSMALELRKARAELNHAAGLLGHSEHLRETARDDALEEAAELCNQEAGAHPHRSSGSQVALRLRARILDLKSKGGTKSSSPPGGAAPSSDVASADSPLRAESTEDQAPEVRTPPGILRLSEEDQ